jgi:hypothetical protein
MTHPPKNYARATRHLQALKRMPPEPAPGATEPQDEQQATLRKLLKEQRTSTSREARHV